MEIGIGLGTSSGSANYKYKYNGKELQEEFNINLYDYGARNYDPAIGRWFNIDPLAEKFSNTSTYTYNLNNPLIYNDPSGKEPVPWALRFFNERKPHQWYSNFGSYDTKTFNSASVHNTKILNNR